MFTAGLVVLVGKEPASERTRPERVEQRRRHFSGLDVLGLARFADVDAAEAVQRHRLERVLHLLPVEVIRHGATCALDPGAWKALVREEKAIGFGVGERP